MSPMCEALIRWSVVGGCLRLPDLCHPGIVINDQWTGSSRDSSHVSKLTQKVCLNRDRFSFCMKSRRDEDGVHHRLRKKILGLLHRMTNTSGSVWFSVWDVNNKQLKVIDINGKNTMHNWELLPACSYTQEHYANTYLAASSLEGEAMLPRWFKSHSERLN